MFRERWQIPFAIALIIISLTVYIIHYYIFRDIHHILIYTIEDIGFLFIEVLLVALIIHQLLSEREKRAMLNKLNMVIGTFYSEVGIELLKRISKFDSNKDKISRELVTIDKWSKKDFYNHTKRLKEYDHNLKVKINDLQLLKRFLIEKREFLLILLENPNLLEHETFTDLLWAVFHLVDELAHRKDLSKLPKNDIDHLIGDIKRAYGYLISEWLIYMKHLKEDYPYLFSLAMRTNPFNPRASIVLT